MKYRDDTLLGKRVCFKCHKKEIKATVMFCVECLELVLKERGYGVTK
jgi:hypothetical protein